METYWNKNENYLYNFERKGEVSTGDTQKRVERLKAEMLSFDMNI